MPRVGEPILTVGMPCFDDYNGVAFTLQSLRMHHREVMHLVELLVIDNNPDTKHGQMTKKLMKSVPNGRYIPHTEWKGPWVKDLVFRNAKAPYVLCMDCHVLLEQRVLARLIDFYNRNEGTGDLYQGPIVYNDLRSISTHFEPVWRGQMWGIWATNTLGMNPDNPPFEIPMQGMGLFSSSRKAWEEVGGFNRLMRGFGGEEGYIHEKYRQRGRKCWCLPWMRWWHRFDRPDGPGYSPALENKVHNYVVGHDEVGRDLEPMVAHFSTFKTRSYVEKLRDRTLREISLDKAKKSILVPTG